MAPPPPPVPDMDALITSTIQRTIEPTDTVRVQPSYKNCTARQRDLARELPPVASGSATQGKKTIENPTRYELIGAVDSSPIGLQPVLSSNATTAKHPRQRGTNLSYETVVIIRGYFERGMVNSLPATLKDRTTVAELTSLEMQKIDVSPLYPL